MFNLSRGIPESIHSFKSLTGKDNLPLDGKCTGFGFSMQKCREWAYTN
jgi:hypothetical protein